LGAKPEELAGVARERRIRGRATSSDDGVKHEGNQVSPMRIDAQGHRNAGDGRALAPPQNTTALTDPT
jgi:hypothetical protein